MPFRLHASLLISGVLTWAAFWVAGLPNYYQQYSNTLLAIGSVLLLFPTWWLGRRMILRAKPEHRLSMALWLSFYFTVPFAICDTLYCGIYLGHGHNYLVQYWYLTIYYMIPWMVFVPIARWSRAT